MSLGSPACGSRTRLHTSHLQNHSRRCVPALTADLCGVELGHFPASPTYALVLFHGLQQGHTAHLCRGLPALRFAGPIPPVLSETVGAPSFPEVLLWSCPKEPL